MKGHQGITIVAGYSRRHALVEEVPGLYIRRLTLEDPRISRDQNHRATTDRADYSRSPSPVRHICHPRSAEARPGRGSSSSYRFWLDRIKNEKPAYLTITSLELPDCPIPLIESQASARWRRCSESTSVSPDKDEILDEFLENVTRVDARDRKKSKSADQSVSKAIQTSRRRRFIDSSSGDDCRKSTAQAPEAVMFGKSSSDEESSKDCCCMCSEITENLRINIREKTEITSSCSPRSLSPEVTHTIRIAMKYLGQPEKIDEEENPKETPKQINCEGSQALNDCGVNVALDFTLNCCSVQLTSREITLKSMRKHIE